MTNTSHPVVNWHVSSYSQGGGNGSCVEAGVVVRWHVSSYSSGGNGGNGSCVEAGVVTDAPRYAVRDSKNRSGGMLTFPSAGWTAFVTELKADRRAR